MKKLILFITLCVACLFNACKKDSKGNNCWKCSFKVTNYEADGGYFITTAKEDVCDKTEEEIRYYEKARSVTEGAPAGGRKQTEVTCSK